MKTPTKPATTPPAAPVKPTPAAAPEKAAPSAAAPNATKARATPAKVYPDWLTDNPGGSYFYEISVYQEGGGSVQTVSMNRRECIQLKFYLARIRNIIGDEVLSRYAPPAQQSSQ